MADLLPDSLPLSLVSMPGTHNSASFAMTERRLPTVVLTGACCQTWDLDTQLRRGVRFLDLRIRPGGELCHGPLDCGVSLRTVLDICAAFLQRNPGEVLIARIKDETNGGSQTARGVGGLVSALAPNYPLFMEGRLPCVGEVRGRILVLSDWHGGQIGVLWDGGSMRIQDEYWHATGMKKWCVVARQLDQSIAKPDSLQVHFTSATHLPRKVPLAIARVVNKRLAIHLRCMPCPRFVGIVAMDFPSSSLCELVVRQNQQALDPCRPLHGLTTTMGANARDGLLTLQCELMVAASQADVAAFVHCDVEEHADKTCEVSRLLVGLVTGRVCAELHEPATETSLSVVTDAAISGPRPVKSARRSLVGRIGTSFFGRCAKVS